MSEEPVNPFYMYDDADEEYLEDNLKSKTDEWRRYMNWADRAQDEIRYIQKRLSEKHG